LKFCERWRCSERIGSDIPPKQINITLKHKRKQKQKQKQKTNICGYEYNIIEEFCKLFQATIVKKLKQTKKNQTDWKRTYAFFDQTILYFYSLIKRLSVKNPKACLLKLLRILFLKHFNFPTKKKKEFQKRCYTCSTNLKYYSDLFSVSLTTLFSLDNYVPFV